MKIDKKDKSTIDKEIYKRMIEKIMKEKEMLSNVKGGEEYIKKKLKIIETLFGES